jgi:HYR domain-containing protein/putative Ig domain-containing protein
MPATKDHSKTWMIRLAYTRIPVLVLTLLMVAYFAVTRGSVVLAVGGTLALHASRLLSTVDGPAGPPVATGGTDLRVIENTHLIIKAEGSDPNPGAILTGKIIYISNAGTLFQVNPDGTRGIEIGSVTGILGVSITNPDRLVWYEPSRDFFGIDSFQYYLQDNFGGQSRLVTTTIHVTHLNQAPQAFPATHSSVVTEFNLTSIVLNASDRDPGQRLIFHITQFPNVGRLYRSSSTTPENQVAPANPTFEGTHLFYTSNDFPNPSTDAFSYYVSDEELSSPEVTDVIDLELVSPPNIGSSPSLVATTENTPLPIVLKPTDPRGQTSSLGVFLTNGPQHGSLCHVNLSGECQQVTAPDFVPGPDLDGKSWSLTYKPENGFNTDGGAPDSFSYTLSTADGVSSGPFTVQIYVIGATDQSGCPAISITPGTVPGGNLNSAYSPVTFSAGGGTGPYHLSEIGALPSGMTFADGVLSGTPTEAGSSSFVVVAAYDNGCTAAATYQFLILDPPPMITVGGPLSVKADGSVSLAIVATVGDSALPPGSLKIRATGAPSGIDVVGLKNTDGVVTAYVGASCDTPPGSYSVALLVSDTTDSVGANLVLNVTAPATPVTHLSYPDHVTLSQGQSSVVNPTVALDGGRIGGVVAVNNSYGGYDGTISVNSDGVVTLGAVGPPGKTFTISVTVVFGCGATRDVSFTLVVPCSVGITCPADISTSTDPNQCSAVVTYATPSATSNCGTATVTCSPASGSTFAKGVTTVTCTATDNLGNTGSCAFTITVNDAQPPSIIVPDSFSEPTAVNQCSVVVYYGPAARDNCPGVTTNCDPPSGSAIPKGVTTVTCTATDTSGNTASGSFTITVIDTQPPSIACPANITKSTDPNSCSALVSYAAPTVTDNCPGATATCTPPSGTTFPKGVTTVTCIATDASGNQSSCSFAITVNDTQAPTITGPSAITAVAPLACPTTTSTTVSYPSPVVSDNCPGVTFACSPASGSSFSVGTTTVTCTATDSSGNKSSCSFTVSVFNVCLQDDSSPATRMLIDTVHGAYRFICGSSLYEGTGTITQAGCQFSLNHEAMDRRVHVSLNTISKTGNASIQSPTGVTRCTITDRNMSDNACLNASAP